MIWLKPGASFRRAGANLLIHSSDLQLFARALKSELSFAKDRTGSSRKKTSNGRQRRQLVRSPAAGGL